MMKNKKKELSERIAHYMEGSCTKPELLIGIDIDVYDDHFFFFDVTLYFWFLNKSNCHASDRNQLICVYQSILNINMGDSVADNKWWNEFHECHRGLMIGWRRSKPSQLIDAKWGSRLIHANSSWLTNIGNNVYPNIWLAIWFVYFGCGWMDLLHKKCRLHKIGSNQFGLLYFGVLCVSVGRTTIWRTLVKSSLVCIARRSSSRQPCIFGLVRRIMEENGRAPI